MNPQSFAGNASRFNSSVIAVGMGTVFELLTVTIFAASVDFGPSHGIASTIVRTHEMKINIKYMIICKLEITKATNELRYGKYTVTILQVCFVPFDLLSLKAAILVEHAVTLSTTDRGEGLRLCSR